MPKGLLAMGAYLDRLNAQFDEIRDGIDAVVNRAAEDNRDVTETEQGQVDRDRTRLTELQTAIGHYTELENQSGKVAELRRTLPAPVQTRTAKESEPEYEAAREFPTAGDYAYTVHRALALKDPEAVAKLERATAHQLTSDNPGIIPRPVLGPVLNFLNATRPFINAISNRPLPGPSFDRPTITQHVAVGKQAAEKTLTDSQKMVVGKIPVNAATYAGHLNISRQDIKWSSPAILNIVFDDFAAMYALATCDDAVTQFAASIAGNAPVAIPSADAAGFNSAFFGAAAASLTANGVPADTLFASPDMWATLGGAVNPNSGNPVFPSMSLGSSSGNPLGLKLVVDEHFAAETLVMGPSRLVEWYEDVDGLMQVGEPDVLGQLVGYAGYGAFVNVNPAAFTVFSAPPVIP
jgi:HK97 family phage major capsid protein